MALEELLQEPPILSRFTGSNPALWISQAERYFHFHAIYDDERFPYVIESFDDEPFWWFNGWYRSDFITWNNFTAAMFTRFHTSSVDSNDIEACSTYQTQAVIDPTLEPDLLDSKSDANSVVALSFTSGLIRSVSILFVINALTVFDEMPCSLDNAIANAGHKTINDEVFDASTSDSALRLDPYYVQFQFYSGVDMLEPLWKFRTQYCVVKTNLIKYETHWLLDTDSIVIKNCEWKPGWQCSSVLLFILTWAALVFHHPIQQQVATKAIMQSSYSILVPPPTVLSHIVQMSTPPMVELCVLSLIHLLQYLFQIGDNRLRWKGGTHGQISYSGKEIPLALDKSRVIGLVVEPRSFGTVKLGLGNTLELAHVPIGELLPTPKLFVLDNAPEPPDPYTTLSSASFLVSLKPTCIIPVVNTIYCNFLSFAIITTGPYLFSKVVYHESVLGVVNGPIHVTQLHFYMDVMILEPFRKFWELFGVVDPLLHDAYNWLLVTTSLVIPNFEWKPGWRGGPIVDLRELISSYVRFCVHYKCANDVIAAQILVQHQNYMLPLRVIQIQIVQLRILKLHVSQDVIVTFLLHSVHTWLFDINPPYVPNFVWKPGLIAYLVQAPPRKFIVPMANTLNFQFASSMVNGSFLVETFQCPTSIFNHVPMVTGQVMWNSTCLPLPTGSSFLNIIETSWVDTGWVTKIGADTVVGTKDGGGNFTAFFTISLSCGLHLLGFVQNSEVNILAQFLHNKLSTLGSLGINVVKERVVKLMMKCASQYATHIIPVFKIVLIYVHMKCGATVEAFQVFNLLQTRDIFAWNKLLMGMEMHEHAYEAPLDMYGAFKFGPLQDFSIAIQLCVVALLTTNPSTTSLGQILEVGFSMPSTTCASFLDPDITSFEALYGHKPPNIARLIYTSLNY